MGKFKGIFATPVTAFDKYGEVDPSGIRRLIDFIAEKGIKNIFCLGSWGGFALLDKEERIIATQGYLDACKANSMKCIVNVSATTPRQAIFYAKYAEDNGADAIASLVPLYYSSSGYDQRNILKYFDELISSTNIPVHFYNNPRTTGYKLNMQMFESLLSSGLAGMKEGGGDPTAFVSMMNFINKKKIDFDMIPGSVTMLLMGKLYRVKATMIGSAVVFPELAISSWNDWENNNIDGLALKHALLMKIRQIQSLFGMGAAACYDLLNFRRVNIGNPRSPWIGLSSEDARFMQSELQQFGLPI